MISPLEIMRHSILCHEGRVKEVKAVSELILFEGEKAWIGGSMVNGESISEEWLVRLSLVKTGNEFYWADPKTSRIIYIMHHKEDSWLVSMSVASKEPINIRLASYVHQIQLIFFGIIGEHLVLPKLTKIK